MDSIAKADTTLQTTLGFIAVVLAAANAVGGFMLNKKTLQVLKNQHSKIKAGDE